MLREIAFSESEKIDVEKILGIRERELYVEGNCILGLRESKNL